MKCHKGTANFCLSPIRPVSASEKEKESVDNFPLLSILRTEVLLRLCSLQGAQIPESCAAAVDAGRGWEDVVKPTAPRCANEWGGNGEMSVASSQMVVKGSVDFLQGLATHLHNRCAVPCPKATTLRPVPLLCVEAKAMTFLKGRPEFCLKKH